MRKTLLGRSVLLSQCIPCETSAPSEKPRDFDRRICQGLETALQFANHFRSGLSQFIATKADANGLPTSNSAEISIDASGRGLNRTVSHVRKLTGPGAIAGIDKSLIVARDPPNGAAGAEPVNFPSVAFSAADLPWRYTPAAPNNNGALAPWMVLAILPEIETVTLIPGSGGRYHIKIDENAGDLLIPPEETRYWAHVQLGLDGKPELSRLLCPRRLDPETKYIAALVPLFEAGRLAGLGQEVTEGGPITAWTTETEAVTLPTYDHWHFTTGADDFETLARRLYPAPPDPRLGRQVLDLTEPGHGLDADDLNRPVFAENGVATDYVGVLSAIGGETTEWPERHRGVFEKQLTTAVDQAVKEPEDELSYEPLEHDPVIAPPKYGSWQNAEGSLDKGWSREVNLDPALRLSAGMGARSFRREEEAHMAEAWRQLGEAKKATQVARGLRVSMALNGRIYERVSELPLDTRLQITRPAHSKMRRRSGPDLDQYFANQPDLPEAVFERAFTRTTARIDRRVAKFRELAAVGEANETEALAGSAVKAVLRGQLTITATEKRYALPDKLIDYDMDVSIVGSMLDIDERVLVPIGRPSDGLRRMTLERSPSGDLAARNLAAATLNKNKAAALADVKDRSVRAASQRSASLLPNSQLNQLVRASLVPLPQLKQRFLKRVAGAQARVFAPVPIPPVPQAPIRFQIAACEEIAARTPEILMPGAGDLPTNAVSMVKSNQEVVAAFLMGLNHEASREFAWRQLSTDLSATWFHKFWDYLDDRDDIGEISDWKSHTSLRENLLNSDTDSVIVTRAQLFARHPDTIVYAIPAVWNETKDKPVYQPKLLQQAEAPLFQGTIGRMTRYFAFDLLPKVMAGTGTERDPGWYVVFEQPRFAPRFGLDAADVFAPRQAPSVTNDLSWGHFAANEAKLAELSHAPVSPKWKGDAVEGFKWGRSPADMAAMTYQRPVRVLIHCNELVSI